VPKSWTDLESSGRRMERLCRMLDKRIKNLDPDDYETLVKLANSIAYVTKTKIEIINIHLNLKTMFSLCRRKYGIDELDRAKMI